MPRKQADKTAEEEQSAPPETATTLLPVKVTVTRAHCLTPHSIELRKNDAGLVTLARTEDWRHIYTIGAKPIEHIFAEAGHDVPASDETELEIVISPYTGEIVAIQPKSIDPLAAETSADESGNDSASGSAGDESQTG
jgi:hypothetical protein